MNDIHTVAAEVASELGSDWSLDREWPHRGAYLSGPDGARVFLGKDWQNDNRVEISGSYPNDAHHIVGRVTHHKIGVSISRGAATIAKEIQRRLLPDYTVELARVNEAMRKHEEHVTVSTELANELADLLGTTATPPTRGSYRAEIRLYLDGIYGGVSVGADRVDMELRSITPDMARDIARIVRKGNPS